MRSVKHRNNDQIEKMQTDKTYAAVFRDRLEAAMDKNNIPPLQKGRIVTLAKMLNTSQLTVRRWLDQDNPILPNTQTLIEISKVLGVTIDYILGIDQVKRPEEYGPNEKTHIKLSVCEIEDGFLVCGRESYIHREAGWMAADCDYFAYKVNSDAMFPSLQIGDVAIMESVKDIVENKIYAMYYEGRVTFRRLMPTKNAGMAIMADNRHYPAIEFNEKEFKIMTGTSKSEELPSKGILVILGRVLKSVKNFN